MPRPSTSCAAAAAIVLAGTMLMPAFAVGDLTLAPYQSGPSCPPHVLAAVIGGLALARATRIGWLWALRIVSGVVGLFTLLFLPGDPAGEGLLVLTTIAIAVFASIERSEGAGARAALVLGIGATLWFVQLARTVDARALAGFYVAIASSVALAIASVLWLRDLRAR
jgi:hypothetical protein